MGEVNFKAWNKLSASGGRPKAVAKAVCQSLNPNRLR
jgi:hypothetical protein